MLTFRNPFHKTDGPYLEAKKLFASKKKFSLKLRKEYSSNLNVRPLISVR
jgi:hypothetical protein